MRKGLTLLSIIVAISVFAILGCSPDYQKQVIRYHDFSYAHPDEAAKDCAKLFPTKDSIGKPVIDSSKKANNIDYTSIIASLSRQIDSLSNELSSGHITLQQAQQKIKDLQLKTANLATKYKPCKNDTVYRTIPVFMENTAKYDSLLSFNKTQGLQIAKLQQKVVDDKIEQDKTQHGKLMWMLTAIGSWLIVLGTAAWRVYKFFSGGAAIDIVKKVI